MIIPVHLSTSDTSYSTLPSSLAVLGSSEVVLIELQGALEVEGDPTAGHIGTLDMNNAARPSLRIGHHLLEGKIVSLPKPFAVLARSSSTSDPQPNVPAPSSSEDEQMEVQGTDVSFEIVAIVKKKVVFAKRPMPIVGDALMNR